jgi:tRNA dimethylallyltransferase
MNAVAHDEKPLVVVLGPTASGKSALGIELARRFGGEVLVCDSTQVFRRFDVGTAKVPLAEQQGVPHRLVDLVEPDEVFTAGEYRRRALAELDALKARNKLPILTAGTGLYLRALLEGLADAPERSEELRERLRKIVERRGAEHLHAMLKRMDPEAAKKVALRDTQKVIRAIEIRMLSRKRVADVWNSGRDRLQGYRATKIGLAPDRKALYSRINARTHAMIDAGWLEEVRQLVTSGISPAAKPFQFIGYSELRDHLAGRLTHEDAIRHIQQATRNFAKRQITWFRREPDVHWLAGFGDEANVQQKAFEIASGALTEA